MPTALEEFNQKVAIRKVADEMETLKKNLGPPHVLSGLRHPKYTPNQALRLQVLQKEHVSLVHNSVRLAWINPTAPDKVHTPKISLDKASPEG